MTTTKAYDRKRRVEKPWRSWYNKKEWYQLKAHVIERDSVLISGRLVPQCQATGELLTGAKGQPNSPVVDHKQPHRGDPKKFFSANNCWTVSKSFHDSVKQRWEKRKHGPIGEDGWPLGQ